MLPEGQQLGHYRLVYLLNSGGMGEVYLAEDRLLHRQVAIKVIQTDLAYFEDAEAANEGVRQFLHEARAIARLDHPHILPLYDSDETAIRDMPLMYMVMPFRQDGSLAEWLQDHPQRPFSPQEIAYIVQQAADALQHAHEHQIIHQDVKPANFLIRSRNGWRLDLQLADFGIAELMTRTSQESQIPRGTPAYVAPEQWEGHPLPATDQYALAVMTYELLTGNVPFSGLEHEVMHKHLHVIPRPPSEVNPLLPASIDGVLLRALKKRPVERYPSISAFARAFQRALDDNGAVYQTVAVSPAEAEQGTYRTLLLSGRRRVSVDIPPGVVHGEMIKFRGMGEPAYGGQPGSLILTIKVEHRDSIAILSRNNVVERTTPVVESQRSIAPSASTRRIRSFPAWGTLPLVLLLILGSGGLFYVTQVQAMNAASKSATTTAQSVYNTEITQAQDATATVDVRSSASAVAQEAATSTSTSATVAAHVKQTATVSTAATTAATDATSTAATVIAQTDLTATATALAATRVAATATVATSATVQAERALASAYATAAAGGTLQFTDPLQDNGLGYHWDETSSSGGGCAFTNNAYHASVKQTSTVSPCFARVTDYSNIFLQVQVQILGGDQGGLAFCADAMSNTFYYFRVGRDGTYALEIYKDGNQVGTLYAGKSGAIKTGLKQTNLLAVHVKNGKIDLYVNMQPMVSVDDTTLTHGQIGVVAEDSLHPTDVAFSNVLLRVL